MTEQWSPQEPWGSKSVSSRLLDAVQMWRQARRSARYDDSIFIKIPKNAGTSAYKMLYPNGLVKLNTPRSVKLFFRNSGRVTFGHMSIGSLVEHGMVSREFVDRAFKFAITRDPYARAASLYRVHCGLMRNCHNRPTFVDFLQWVSKGYYDRIGLYSWRGWSQCNPQVEWLRDAWPDKIYKTEDLTEFVTDITERWGIAQPDIVHINRSADRDELRLSREEQALIEQIYAEDFETFGYPKR